MLLSDNFPIYNLQFSIRAFFFLDFFDCLTDVEMDWAVQDTSTAAHARDPTEVLRKIVELMHQPLPRSFTTRRPWIMS